MATHKIIDNDLLNAVTVNGTKTAIKKKRLNKVKPIAVNGHSNGFNGKVVEIENKIAHKKVSTKTANAVKVNIKKNTSKKAVSKKEKPTSKKAIVKTQHIVFQIKFHTKFGQQLFITGNHHLFGNNDIDKALPMQYLNEEWWTVAVDFNEPLTTNINYNYIFRNTDGSLAFDFGKDKTIAPSSFKTKDILIKDSWNAAGNYQNAFFTEPFSKVLLKANYTPVKVLSNKNATHQFRVKAPLLLKGQTICICGNGTTLKEWNTKAPVLMHRNINEDYFNVNLDLSNETFPVAYKYGVYDVDEKKFLRFEDGSNHLLYDEANPNKTVIVNNGFAFLNTNEWRGAGVAIPVFSLRSNKSFGVGEFADLKLLVDWSVKVGLKLIQLLPVNDTIATHTWIDSYPYSAISAFALHPMFLNLQQLAGDEYKVIIDELEEKRVYLNALPDVDYEAVMEIKSAFIKQIFSLTNEKILSTEDYQLFFEQNKQWLVPYAAFCYLRDEYGTADFNQWPENNNYDAATIDTLITKAGDAARIHFFTQYHLHVQLKEATAYAHEKGVIVKGDIPIGVYRFGADVWQQPELYNINLQAGAPPDDFAVKGQNWGFPTYNWQRMKQDGFAWWKQRFEQMSYYFDAFRIDHILGFFRIWSIPMHAVEGIMGHFVPAIPVNINEFNQRNISFNFNRYTKPYITETLLWQVFGDNTENVKNTFLNYDGFENYTLKPAFNTQRKVEQHFLQLEESEFNQYIKIELFNLISNVILFEVEGSQGAEFHFRFAVSQTSSFKSLDGDTQQKLNELYINYFFRRQDDYWMKEALQKLPALKSVTNMLVCGEDLGLVPACVPDVMKQLGLLSLEIQRMPKDFNETFFNPANAPYLSVVTPSTHDMSTIRGWWEEDHERIQKFYNTILGQSGQSPQFCEAWINKAIVLQHLQSPAMWSIFQLQDLMGMNETVRRNNPNDERINVPSNPKNYWKYRMHLSLEALLNKTEFNNELQACIALSGR